MTHAFPVSLTLSVCVLLTVATSQAHPQSLPLAPEPASTVAKSLASGNVEMSENTSPDSASLRVFKLSAAKAALPSPEKASTSGEPICGISQLGRCLQDFGEDEVGIFTSPFRLQPKDALWLAPLGAATGLAITYDPGASKAAGVDASRTNTANRVANFGSILATGGEGAGIYFAGLTAQNPKLAETGRLGVEAVVESGTVTLAVKLATNRQRPRQGDGQGDFWPYGTNHWEWDSSFPSDHATSSMALARVIAGEYPHWYVMVPAYGFAETIGISRILANQHFPSDILVGQAIGFLTGSYVLNHHALYRSGKKATLVTKMVGSITPIADARQHAFGASMQIPIGR